MEKKSRIPDFIAKPAKAWVAAVTTAVLTAFPAIEDATNTAVAALISGALAYATTWLVRDRPA